MNNHPTPTEIRALLTGAGLTQAAAAALIGVSLRAMQNYVADPSSQAHRKMPQPHWRLLQMLAKNK